MQRKSTRNPRRAFAWRYVIPVLVLFFALFLAWHYTPLADIASAEQMAKWARGLRQNVWAALLVAAIFTPAAFIMFPRPLLTLFAVLVFGPWRGFAVAMSGIVGSALATYLVGRKLPERTLQKLAGKKLGRASEAIRQRGFASVLAVTIAPVAPFPVVGMAAGAVRIKLRHYVPATMLGMLPGTLATTVFAHQIESALEHPERINYWVVAAIIGVLVALMLLARRWLLKLQQQA